MRILAFQVLLATDNKQVKEIGKGEYGNKTVSQIRVVYFKSGRQD